MAAMDGSDPAQPLVVADADAWHAWLLEHDATSDGVWLLLAKKGVTEPTSLSYAEALDEALCSGWIDGQRKSRDATTFLQRYTPRRARSMWSQRNLEHVARLIAAGRMRGRGEDEIARAKADGRWDRAYAGPASAVVPDDLLAALDAVPGGRERFEALSSQARFAVLHPLMTAPNDVVRQRRLAKAVAVLSDHDA